MSKTNTKDRISVDFNFSFTGLNGKPVEGTPPANEVLASMLFNGRSDGDKKVRNVNWALKLQEGGIIELNSREIDEVLQVCDAGQLKDGYYIALQKFLEEKRDELRDQQKSSGKK